MFGINNSLRKSNNRDLRLKKVLNRKIPIDSLTSLIDSMGNKSPVSHDIKNSAIAFDANAILRIPQAKNYVDIFDYISSSNIPIILPSQILQEFWNNQFSAIDSSGQKFKRKFDDLKKEAKVFDDFNAEISSKIDELLNEIEREFKHVYDEETLSKAKKFLEVLKIKAYLSSVDRSEFYPIAKERMTTKTPPGFKDDGDGDFFVWVEILSGAMKLIDEKVSFEKLIFVTNDAKVDWVINNNAHPILTAEVKKLTNKHFEIWKLQDYLTAIKKEL